VDDVARERQKREARRVAGAVGDPIPLLSERPRSAGSSVRRLRAIDPERGDGE
jgi:hypothetical protein